MENNDDAILYRILRPVLTIFFKFLYLPVIEGKEHISKNKGIVLAGNHTSNLDCLLLMSATKKSIHFLAKDELWKFPLGIIFSHMGLISVNRKGKSHNSLEKAYKYLNNNSIVLVFPEGTTEKKRGLLPFKMGAVKMAAETNSQITPFVITGKYRLFRRSIKIKFLTPISITKDLESENNNLRNIIKNELEALHVDI